MITEIDGRPLEEYPCYAKGSRCELCVEIGDEAMRQTLAKRANWSEISAEIAVENSGPEVPIEAAAEVATLSCEKRRARAAGIGEKAAIEKILTSKPKRKVVEFP